MKVYFCKLQIVFVLCFVVAQISPACAFVSGKLSLIEICAADGSLKTIQISEQFNPFKEKSPNSSHTSVKECAFCFSHANMGKIPEFESVMAHVVPSSYMHIGVGLIVPVSYKNSQTQPRAPPVVS